MLCGALTGPALRPWNIHSNDILSERELLMMGLVRAALPAVGAGLIVRACDQEEATVQWALEQLANLG
jgi:hypothetical protein